MNFRRPPEGHRVTELFSEEDLIRIAAPENRGKLQAFRDVIHASKSAFEMLPELQSINSFCLRATGELWLITIYRTKTWEKRWNFGDFLSAVNS